MAEKTKQKNDATVLSLYGDFSIAAVKDGGEQVVSIVTSFEYAGSRRVNEKLSDPALNTVVSQWAPKVEEFPASKAVKEIDDWLKHYRKILDDDFAGMYAWEEAGRATRGLTAAKKELQQLKL